MEQRIADRLAAAEAPLTEIANLLANFTGWAAGDISVEQGRAEIALIPREGRPRQALLLHPDTAAPTEGLVVHAKVALLILPGTLPPELGPRLAAALDARKLQLPWIRVEASARSPSAAPPVFEVDPARHRTARDARLAALALRRGAAWPRALPPAPKAPATLGTGLSPGALSAWIAAGRFRAPPACRHCLAAELHRALTSPRDREAALRELLTRFPAEPKLWVALAWEALRRGHLREAAELADAATQLPPPDADALRLWALLSGAPATEPPGALPALWLPASLAAPAWIAALLALAALLWVAAAWDAPRRRRVLLLVCAPSLVLGALAWRQVQTARPPPQVAPSDPPGELVAALEGGPCATGPLLRTEEGAEILLHCWGIPYRFELRAPEDRPVVVTLHGRDQGHHTSILVQRLTEAVRAAESRGWRPGSRHPDSPADRLGLLTSSERGEVALSAALAASSLLPLLLILLLCAAVTLRAARRDRPLAVALALSLAATVALHILLPRLFVMEYAGYDLAADLGQLRRVPRYGAGLVWLYRPFFAAFGVDTTSLQLANRFLGALTWLPVAAGCLLLGRRATGRARWGLLGILLWTALPVIWRDHMSEGLITGYSLLLLTALAGLLLATRRGRAWALLPLAPLLAYLGTGRPEALAGLGILALFAAPAILRGRPFPRRPLLLAALAVAAASLPHVLWMRGEVALQVAETGVKALDASFLPTLGGVLLQRNIFLMLPWALAPLLFWVLAALSARPSRPWSLGALLCALVWLALSATDLPTVSIPRVHLPAALVMLPLLGPGAYRLNRRALGPLRLLNPLLLCALAYLAFRSFTPAFTPPNAQAEDALIQRAAQVALPGTCVAHVSHGDPPAPGKTQRHFPEARFPGRRISGLDELSHTWPRCHGEATAILGTRCFMRMREPGEVAPADGELDVCKRFRQRWRLEPVEERTIENRTDRAFPIYPAAATLRLGVYRVLGPR